MADEQKKATVFMREGVRRHKMIETKVYGFQGEGRICSVCQFPGNTPDRCDELERNIHLELDI